MLKTEIFLSFPEHPCLNIVKQKINAEQQTHKQAARAAQSVLNTGFSAWKAAEDALCG